ncbi:DUF349 domain-containing protein [Lacinutrix sp. 5H-3-7-4]|uniref:DUF349 domain-containing protein n=1 Tax=Lacinutrix sp. (strain 5H-3-7-4) TaxID=983544 RepID=UPI00020A3AAF|nr:DUF349 domain-containing protein [Lacinutrix sp. 5H-3-7-4]AEH00064.1 protein of unknown function DUF349 [Lacinutrix sp. 5H-3-7-4]
MSEQDNLLNADGIEDKNPTKNTSEQEPTNSTPEDTTTKNTNSDSSDDDLINEIDESNAEDAEDEGNVERHSIEEKDYHAMSLDELVIELEKLVKNQKVQAIKKHVETIKSEFTEKFNALLDDKKEDFLSKGGNEIDFQYSNPLQRSFKDTYKEYRTKLNTHYKNLEKGLKDNLSSRLDIIEQIKTLTDSDGTMNSKYKEFKDLQEQWKNAGSIPRDKYNNAWNSYHFNVERFYDLLHLDRDLRDKDFEHNLEKKTKIIERAEELVNEENTNRAFRELQALHKLWKEDLGPVAKEHREVIWERFKQATKAINAKRQDYFKHLDELYEKNLELKQGIIAIIKEKTQNTQDNHKSWQNKIKEIETLREEFFKAGKVPIKVNEATWAQFKEAVRAFNHKKNAFYKNLKKDQYVNLEKKQALVKIAEDNKDSDDFEKTTALMKKIQSDWKRIGHVPRKDSDKIWKQFRAACNHYFDRVHAKRNEASAEEEKAYQEKENMLKLVKETKLTGEQKADLATIKQHIANWKNIGRVPGNKRRIESEFNKALDTLFGTLDMNKSEVEMMKYENKLQDLSSARDQRALENEYNFIRKKIGEINAEITQLQNNLLFFKDADRKNPLVKSVYDNIDKQTEALKTWKAKLKKIKVMENAKAKAEEEAQAAAKTNTENSETE